MGETVSAVVLAGGRATRLGGTNKALLELNGRPIIRWMIDALEPLAEQILLVGHLAEDLDLSGVQVLADPYPGAGTLAALHTGLRAARSDVAVVVACDMPFLSAPLLRRIVELSDGYDVAAPRIGPHLEALHAAYRKSCLPVIEEALGRQQLKIIDFYASVRTHEVPEAELRAVDRDLLSFFNVNTPEDLERARLVACDRVGPSAKRAKENKMPPIVSVVGRSDSGKTTFLEKLIPALKSRGLRVAVVKHDSHGFEMDRPGKDTWRLREAGADAVMISAPNQMALIRSRLEREVTLDEMTALVGSSVDIVLTEGYKSGDKPKIEVSRRDISGGELLCTKAELLAVVADGPRPLDVPRFGLDDADGVADLLVDYLKQADS